ncbi:hypothetical protein Poly51_51100 [Rubripirellula tenax]|uniref:Uncharacterized protein n=1 Tax=Rubripirellula tenax TaxID=2528015 RepID=A0A5C6EFF2_9BACT|nr:hypothetical protein [Rubripirellula tenax]TWU47310.1 hypothetical protein Poly51_51100 [Rubripirellula tenax]
MAVMLGGGCSLFPETRQRDSVHNPFPQLKRIAILPFYNQSNEPTVDTQLVAEKYYASLQAIPGFEVLPIGVTKAQWLQYAMAYGEPTTGADFQRLARMMGVEAIVVGSVTDFDSFYPPRMAMTVHWYAANDGFHTIPAGYGLPWGTEAEKQIPKRITREAEFELARSQLATQTPISNGPSLLPPPNATLSPPMVDQASVEMETQWEDAPHGDVPYDNMPYGDMAYGDASAFDYADMAAPLPPAWPDPTDLIPDPPSPVRPVAIASTEPVLTHTRIYRGDDPYFTNRLSDFVETGDDARSSGWQGYLRRSDDFISFCCHLHIVEMLESRGGAEQSDLILRWPLSRY